MWFFPHKIMRLSYVKVGSPNHLLDLSGSSSPCVCVVCNNCMYASPRIMIS